MDKNYWVVLLILGLFLIAETISMRFSPDPRGSRQFQDKFTIKNSRLIRLVIFKQKNNPVILAYEFVPYLVLLLHCVILLPVYILYWIFDFQLLEVVLKSLPYQIYMGIFLAIIFIVSIVFRVIDLYKGQKEFKNNK